MRTVLKIVLKERIKLSKNIFFIKESEFVIVQLFYFLIQCSQFLFYSNIRKSIEKVKNNYASLFKNQKYRAENKMAEE